MESANNKYVLWRRVSTKEQANTELGLDAQVAIAEYFMKCQPYKIFTDIYTGTKLNECKELWKAIKYCKEKKIHLVIAKTDRFRNVVDALTILDELGEGNLTFCDLPTTDRTVLTIVFAMWERQAIQGRINTRLALAERRKQRDTYGSWISKRGNVCARFGRPADWVDKNGKEHFDMSRATEASVASKKNAAIAWRQQSAAYKMVKEWVLIGKPKNDMLAELQKLYEHAPEKFCMKNGKCVTKCTLEKWCREITSIVV